MKGMESQGDGRAGNEEKSEREGEGLTEKAEMTSWEKLVLLMVWAVRLHKAGAMATNKAQNSYLGQGGLRLLLFEVLHDRVVDAARKPVERAIGERVRWCGVGWLVGLVGRR